MSASDLKYQVADYLDVEKILAGEERFPNNESFIHVPLENRIVGVVYIVFSILCVIPYVTCLWCIMVDRNLRNKPTYLIVIHVGIADILQLVLNGIAGGIYTIAGTTWGFIPNKIVGGFMNIGWVVYTALAHVLAFNRYICICKPHYKNTVFSSKNTKLMMYTCWLYGLAWLIAYMCPDVNLVYNVYYRNWDYDEVHPSRICWLVELIQDTTHFFMSIIWYAFSFQAIRKTAASISAAQINENKKERKLLIQAMLICAMIGLTLVGFFLVPQIDDGTWTTTASTIIWLACCGNNCAIYLKFNKSLRRRVFLAMRCKKHEKVNKNGPGTITMMPTTIGNKVGPTSTAGKAYTTTTILQVRGKGSG